MNNSGRSLKRLLCGERPEDDYRKQDWAWILFHRYEPAGFLGWAPERFATSLNFSSCTVCFSETISPVLLQVSWLVIIRWLHGNGSDVKLFASSQPLLSVLAAALRAELCIWVVIKASRLVRAGGSCLLSTRSWLLSGWVIHHFFCFCFGEWKW